MALKECTECQRMISTDAKRCPGCGSRQNTIKIPTWLGLLIALLVVVWIFNGIGESRKTSKDTEQKPTISTSMSSGKVEYPVKGMLYCKQNGQRKIVWMNTDTGSYALNGPAISWVQQNEKQGTPLKGNDGNPFKIGRDYFNSKDLNELISRGLSLCQ